MATGGPPMNTLRSIDIDFEVHKCIETERKGFDETPNDVLRRLLKLGEGAPPRPAGNGKAVPSAGRPWSGKGVTLPTEPRSEWNTTASAIPAKLITASGWWREPNSTVLPPPLAELPARAPARHRASMAGSIGRSSDLVTPGGFPSTRCAASRPKTCRDQKLTPTADVPAAHDGSPARQRAGFSFTQWS